MTDTVELKACSALPKCPFCGTQVKMYVHPLITLCNNSACPIHGHQMPIEAFINAVGNTRPSEVVEAGVDQRVMRVGHMNLPIAFMKQYDPQAEKNHKQNIEKLASRGGVCWLEAHAIIAGKPYGHFSDQDTAENAVVYEYHRWMKALTQPSPPITDEKRNAALDDLSKIDYHPYSPDDGHYDAGFDYEQSGAFMDKHIKTVYAALSQPDKTSVPQEVVDALKSADRYMSASDPNVSTAKKIKKAVASLNGGKEKNHE